MISQLSGTLLEATPSLAVVDVSGIGFELGISSITAASLPAPGGAVRLYTRFRVANDAVSLFGFATPEERTMFDRLIQVSSVGPRLALAVLSKFSVGQLYSVVMAEDAKSMSSVPGVGKKTAQRLILELKGTLAKDRGLAAADVPIGGQLPLAASGEQARDEACQALLSMGFTSQEADLALEGLDDSMTVERMLAAALRRLGMDA